MSTSRPPSRTPDPAPALGFLFLTAAVSGGLIMVVEVLGSRVIGPFFGVSLFVWTALITTTLLALAAGYAVGGWIADRHNSARVLYGLVIAAGIAALVVPALKAPVLGLTANLGLRTGAFLSSILLFGPCLFLLGCVSPFVVRLSAPELHRIGRRVGLFYAVSTLGSFLGTVLTGFYLLAWIGVRGIFLLTGGLLILLGGAYFAVFQRRYLPLVLLFLPLFQPAGDRVASKRLANGTLVERIHYSQSFYAELQVLDYSGSRFRTRELILDGLIQGGVDRDSGLSIYEYSYLLERLGLGLAPEARTCLVVGLGAGVVPQRLEDLGLTCDVVDINPEVASVAESYFDFEARGQVVIDDARRFLLRSNRSYDIVVLDVFTGDTTPAHLMTLEAMESIRSRLSKDGVVVANLIGSLGAEARMTASIVRTLEAVFDQVQLHSLATPAGYDSSGNLVIAAYRGPLRTIRDERALELPVHPLAIDGLRKALATETPLPRHPNSIILSDDYNPIDIFDLELKERVRRDILRGSDWEILLL